ncbi:MAG: TolC family outer membrane protein [Magnetococcales bacterium]|nr:TolC family outer membrane protein [Magnetococcales bacterium]
MKRAVLTTSLLCLLSLTQPATVWALTLGDAVNEALRSNPKLLAAGQELEETRQKIRQAFAGYLPTIDFSMGTGREWTNSPTTRFVDRGGLTMNRGETGMNINQPIFDGFNTVHKVEQARAQVLGADYSYLDTAETVTLDVALAFAEVQKQRRLIELAKETMTIHTDVLIKTRQTIRLGITAEMDARQAESRLSLIASDLAATEGALRTAESRFSSLVGFPPGALTSPLIDKKMLPTSRGDAMETAMNRHPALLAAKADLDATRAESKANAAALWPKISLEMGVADSANAGGTKSYTQEASAMLRFKYNLFRGGADGARFKESSFKAARFLDKMTETRNQIEEKVNRSWNALLASRTRLHSLEKHVETTAAVNRDHQEQYRLGSQTMLDLLNAEHELQAARRLLVEEEFQFMMESFRLLAAMGLLKETLIQPDPVIPATLPSSGKTASAAPPPPGQGTQKPVTPPANRPQKSPTPSTAPDAPLTRAQEEAMSGLVEALFLEEPGKAPSTAIPASPVQKTPLPETTQARASDEKSSAAEARAALEATAVKSGNSDKKEVSTALDALAKTVQHSAEQNPTPAANSVPTENRRTTPEELNEMDRIPLHEFVHLMTNEEVQPSSKSPSPDLLQYTIQIGAFRDEPAAIKLIGQLQEKGYDFYLQEIKESQDRTWYRVSIGRLDTEREARALLKQFTQQEARPGFITPVMRKGTSTVQESMPFTPPPPLPPEMGPPENRVPPVPPPEQREGFAVQVAAFQDPMETEKRLVQLSARGLDLYLCETRDANGRTWQLIWIGRYPDRESARAAAESFFKNSGEPAQVIEIRPSTPEDPQVITRVGAPA